MMSSSIETWQFLKKAVFVHDLIKRNNFNPGNLDYNNDDKKYLILSSNLI